MNIRNVFKNGIRLVVNQFIRGGEQSDLFAAINVLDEVANELRARAATIAMNNAIQGLTYEEWRNRGYAVMLGQRHTGRRQDGVCTFAPNQVTPVGGYTGNNVKYPPRQYNNQLDFGNDFADDDIPF